MDGEAYRRFPESRELYFEVTLGIFKAYVLEVSYRILASLLGRLLVALVRVTVPRRLRWICLPSLAYPRGYFS